MKASRHKHPHIKGSNRLLTEARQFVKKIGQIENTSVVPHRADQLKLYPDQIEPPLQITHQNGNSIKMILRTRTGSQAFTVRTPNPGEVARICADHNQKLLNRLAFAG